MKKTFILILISVFTLNFAFAQEDGDFMGGTEEVIFAYFGSVCTTIPFIDQKMMCSNDQIKEFIATLPTPEIVEKKQIKASVEVYFDINTLGETYNVSIKKSSGNTELDSIVLEHFKTMPSWNPMTIDGNPINSENMNIQYSFKPTEKK